MQLFVLTVLVGATCVTAAPGGAESAKKPAWANEQKFGEYQRAWDTIKDVEVTYYMARSTYTNDDTFGKDFKCVTVRTTSVKEEGVSVKAEMTYINNSETGKLNIETQVVKKYGYQTPNALEYGPQVIERSGAKESTGNTQVGILVFSSPQACDIVSVNDNKDLELWVHSNFKDDIPKCCSFTFTYFTSLLQGKTEHVVYSQDDCTN
uniref:Lipocalin n=1 Tax=Rhipicephalus appendiculatus TaxID=34631 RepID=A0A131Z760_RHIAP